MRRERSATESLLSIVLVLDACLVFFAALAAFGLDLVPPPVALLGGLGLIAVLLVTAWLVRYPIGAGVGWVLQVALVATGILLPLMYVTGAGFLALYAYCFVKGRALDRARASTATTKENA